MTLASSFSWLPAVSAGLTTLATLTVSVVIVATKRYHGWLTLDSTKGVQKFHAAPTPRIGGAAILAGLIVNWLVSDRAVQNLLGPMLIAGIPAFAFGFAEDLTKKVGVRARLMATMASGALAWLITGISLTRLDMWGVDYLLRFQLISVALTAFAVGGVANAVNIIDGFNGLASGTLLIGLTAIGTIAVRVGDDTLGMLCLGIAAATAGFGLVNFPFGKIFLGDGGAYLLGFMLAWTAVLLPMRNAVVSPWASLLACGYPVLETFFSIWRKQRREGSSPGQPDRVHLHMLLYSRIARKMGNHMPPAIQNALTSPMAWVIAAIPAGSAILWAENTAALAASGIISAIVYAAVYHRLTQFRWISTPVLAEGSRRAEKSL